MATYSVKLQRRTFAEQWVEVEADDVDAAEEAARDKVQWGDDLIDETIDVDEVEEE